VTRSVCWDPAPIAVVCRVILLGFACFTHRRRISRSAFRVRRGCGVGCIRSFLQQRRWRAGRWRLLQRRDRSIRGRTRTSPVLDRASLHPACRQLVEPVEDVAPTRDALRIADPRQRGDPLGQAHRFALAVDPLDCECLCLSLLRWCHLVACPKKPLELRRQRRRCDPVHLLHRVENHVEVDRAVSALASST
jgi:hypothetical protein